MVDMLKRITEIAELSDTPEETAAQLRLKLYKWRCMNVSDDRILEELTKEENKLQNRRKQNEK